MIVERVVGSLLCEEHDRSNYEDWKKEMPKALRVAVDSLKAGQKDKEWKVTFDSKGKSYIYPNKKGKPTVPWSKDVLKLLGTSLFDFFLYLEGKIKI